MMSARGLLQEAAVAVVATSPASAPSHADAANQHAMSSGVTTPVPPSDSSSAVSPFDVNSHFSPTMIIILVILLSAFFFMGFFAVYVRRCTSEESISRRGSSRRLTARRDELNAGQRGSGVDPLLVESYPMVSYVVAKKKGCNECVVCLGDFEGGEDLKQLPKCKHVFHPPCIGLWLESHTTCPLCRRSLVNSDRWSVSFRWGGSSRGASLSTRLTGEESSRSRRGREMASPGMRRTGSSTGRWWFGAAGRTEDASSRCGAQEETSVRVLDASESCELEPPASLMSSSSSSSTPQHGWRGSDGFSEVAAGSPVSSEVEPRRLGIQASALSSDIMPREIQECCELMPRGQGSQLAAEVAASGLHASRLLSEVATNASSEVAKSGPVESSRKPRQTAAWLSRSSSTGHSLRRAGTGCMPFSLHRSRSVGLDGVDEEEGMVGPACATSEHGPLSGSSYQIPHEPCHVSTSAAPATSATPATSDPFPPSP